MSEGLIKLLGVEREEAADGRAVLILDADDRHLNPYGTVHGGAIATLADSAMGAAVRAAGVETPATIEMKVTYLEPGQPGRLTASAEVRKKGKRITIVECQVEQDGDLVALALATFTS